MGARTAEQRARYLNLKASGKCTSCGSTELRVKRNGTPGITCQRCYDDQQKCIAGYAETADDLGHIDNSGNKCPRCGFRDEHECLPTSAADYDQGKGGQWWVK